MTPETAPKHDFWHSILEFGRLYLLNWFAWTTWAAGLAGSKVAEAITEKPVPREWYIVIAILGLVFGAFKVFAVVRKERNALQAQLKSNASVTLKHQTLLELEPLAIGWAGTISGWKSPSYKQIAHALVTADHLQERIKRVFGDCRLQVDCCVELDRASDKLQSDEPYTGSEGLEKAMYITSQFGNIANHFSAVSATLKMARVDPSWYETPKALA